MKKLPGNEYLVEHSHTGCGIWEGNRSVRKVIAGKDGIYMFAFDMKNRVYDSSKFSKWRSRIVSAKLSD